MSRRGWIAIFVMAAALSCHALTNREAGSAKAVLWSPPEMKWPDKLPPPSVPHEQIREFRLGGMKIRLETTTLQDVQRRFGGSIGHEGDASEALDWLCIGEADANGRWILWLTSSEMGGGRYIDGVQWLRVGARAIADRRCAVMPTGRDIDLPVALRLGMREEAARKALGQPTFVWKDALFYCHEHEETIHSERYTVDSTIRLGLSDGAVREIDADRTSSD